MSSRALLRNCQKAEGAYVTLYETPDGSHDNLTEAKTSTRSGMFEFKLEINKFYVLSVEKAGYTTKKVDFDTDVSLARSTYSLCQSSSSR